MQTKFHEIIKTVENPQDGLDLYLAEDMNRFWNEEYIDEDTNETLTIERTEHIFFRGTKLTPDNISRAMFHYEAGDLKPFKVTNQKRDAYELERMGFYPWKVIIENADNKKFNYLVQAQYAEIARDVAADYHEQTQYGGFSVIEVKQLQNLTFVRMILKERNESEDSQDDPYYKIDVALTYFDDDGEHETSESYILRAKDVEDAKQIIVAYIKKEYNDQRLKIGERVLKNASVTAGAPYNCTAIVDRDFCEEYKKLNTKS